MTLTVAVQMDPVETIHIDRDSTFALALEAQRRGYGLFHYTPGDVALEDGVLTAWARPWTGVTSTSPWTGPAPPL